MTYLRAIEQPDQAVICPNRRLFLSVILNAVLDASGEVRAVRSRHQAAEAEAEASAWIEDAGEDFVFVCHLAGLDPKYVRSSAMSYISRRQQGDQVGRRRAA